jgi:hypothetical protein
VAALFAVHPLNVETVAWVSQRKSLLSTLFLLLGVGACVRYARQGGARRNALVALLLGLGLLAKPMLVSAPLLFLALDFWPLERACSLKSDGPATGWPFKRIWPLVTRKPPDSSPLTMNNHRASPDPASAVSDSAKLR